MRTADLPEPYVPAEKRGCSECRCGVWVSPGSARAAKRLGLAIICMPCAIAKAGPDGLPELFKLQPEAEQLPELLDYFVTKGD